MAALLGYAGMQHALQLTTDRAAEVGFGYVGGGLTAAAACWVVGRIAHRRPMIALLVLTLVGLDVTAAIGALIMFRDIPLHLVGLVVLAAAGGGGQLVGAALGGWMVEWPRREAGDA